MNDKFYKKNPSNLYDWRGDRPLFSEVKNNELIWALNQMQTNTLQWMHLVLHDLEGGGYVGPDSDKETLHDAIALILDKRDAYHSPEKYDESDRPWLIPVMQFPF